MYGGQIDQVSMQNMSMHLVAVLHAHWKNVMNKVSAESHGRIRLLNKRESQSKQVQVEFSAQRCLQHHTVGVFSLHCTCGHRQAGTRNLCTCHDEVAQHCKRMLLDYAHLVTTWLDDPRSLCMIPVPRVRWRRRGTAGHDLLVLSIDTLVMTLRPCTDATPAYKRRRIDE